MKSFERNGYEEYEFLALGSSACDVCRALDGKHFKVKDMLSGENAPPMHPNCRCSTAAYIDDKTYEDWLNAKADGSFDGSLEEWQKLAKSIGKGIIKSGAVSGAYNPDDKEAQEHAVRYYGLVRSMNTDVERIAKNTGYSEKTIQEIKNYIFMEKHDLGGEELEYFVPDYKMGESWRRLLLGSPEPHDLILLKHEIMEHELVSQEKTQEEAHYLTSEKYDYGKEAKKYYDKIGKHKKRRQ